MPPWMTVDHLLPFVALATVHGYWIYNLIVAGTKEEHSVNDMLISEQFRPILLNILNQCDPISFIRMSMTSRGMRIICLNSKGINIIFPCKIAWKMEYDLEKENLSGPFVRFKYKKMNYGHRAIYGNQLAHLKRLPFRFEMYIKCKCSSFVFGANKDAFSILGKFIHEFPNFSITKMFISEELGILCNSKLIDFIEEYRVKSFTSKVGYTMDNVILRYILTKKFNELEISAKILRGTSWMIGAGRVEIRDSNLTADEFKDLLEHIAFDEVPNLVDWVFCGVTSLEPFEALFSTLLFSTKVHFSYEGPLPSTPPIVAGFDNGHSYFLLTSENNIIYFAYYGSLNRLNIRNVKNGGFFIDDVPRPFRQRYLDLKRV